jgi:hypothetical protein
MRVELRTLQPWSVGGKGGRDIVFVMSGTFEQFELAHP